jgi:stalled ribosome alternative rescue factor ArfA
MKKFTRLKMSSDELQQYLVFKRRGKKVEAKKGKGSSYNRREECKIPKEF